MVLQILTKYLLLGIKLHYILNIIYSKFCNIFFWKQITECINEVLSLYFNMIFVEDLKLWNVFRN